MPDSLQYSWYCCTIRSGISALITLGTPKTWPDDKDRCFCPNGKSWTICWLVMKQMKWSIISEETYILFCIGLGTEELLPCSNRCCLAILKRWCVTFGINPLKGLETDLVNHYRQYLTTRVPLESVVVAFYQRLQQSKIDVFCSGGC